jgi:hypothetical protein
VKSNLNIIIIIFIIVIMAIVMIMIAPYLLFISLYTHTLSNLLILSSIHKSKKII